MNSAMLQKQNTNLQGKWQGAKRELEETQTRLAETERKLAQREEALSVLDRNWTQLEDQMTFLASCLPASYT